MSVREITPRELKERLDRKEDVTLIDVREPFERDIASIGGTLIPMKEIPERTTDVPRDGTVVVYCRSGGRSGQVVQKLQSLGYTNLLNLAGGILRWRTEVDPSLTAY